MLELRILNGLHRGATLPLDDHPLTIGADDDADVVLVDPGIAARHARLAPDGAGWTLSTLDGAVLGADHNQPLEALALAPGEPARLGHIWLSIADEDSPWEDPPPEPDDDALSAAGDPVGEWDAGMEQDGPYRDVLRDEAEQAHALAPEQAQAQAPEQAQAQAQAHAQAGTAPAAHPGPQPAAARAAQPARWRRTKQVLVPLTLVSILSACAAYRISARDEAAPAPAATPALRGASAAPPAPPKPVMGPAQLRAAFRQRLQEVDLLKRVTLDLRDDAWTINAALSEEEAARFERILAAFVAAHGIAFPVHAKVGGAEAILPFQVREVVTGAHASVVTEDGTRLYVGDQYRGVRLVAIDGQRLRFDGDRKLQVQW